MANNRMYVVCDHCEDGSFTKAVYIGKRQGYGYYYVPTMQSDWETFYDQHEYCGDTLDHFSIRYESFKE